MVATLEIAPAHASDYWLGDRDVSRMKVPHKRETGTAVEPQQKIDLARSTANHSPRGGNGERYR
jgi:hypothetical protein